MTSRMPKKKPVSTKRGQHHTHKSFWINLVKDVSLTKIDTDVVRKHPDSFEKKKVRFEKRNSDPVYFLQTVRQEFTSLSEGIEFSFWRLSKDNPTLIPLPPEINNAVSLCNFDELNRSSLYIRLQAAPPSITPSSSFTQPQLNYPVPDLINSFGEEAFELSLLEERTALLEERTALHVITDRPGDNDDKKEILSKSSWNVATIMGSDGELLILPLYPASSAPAPTSIPPTTSTMEDDTANENDIVDMTAKEISSVDHVRGNSHLVCIPKKRKITSERGQETVAAKHHQSSSAQEIDRGNEPSDVTGSAFYQLEYVNNLPTTVQVIPVTESYPETNGVPSVMDYNTDEATGQLLTHNSSLMINGGEQDQLSPEKRGYSSSLDNFYNHLTEYQPNSYQQPSGNSTWISDQLNPDSVPNLINAPYLQNYTDSHSAPLLNTSEISPQQRTSVSLDTLSTQKPLNSHVLQMQELVPQNTSNSGSTCRSTENVTDNSNHPHSELLGKIKLGSFDSVKDITVMNGKVYIVYEKDETLLVCGSGSSSIRSFQKEKEIRVHGMKNPRYIKACAEKDCLFISDGESNSSVCIWSVKDGNEIVIEKLMEDVECRSLSVTRNGELLIVDSKHKCIHSYGSDGRCLRCVKLLSIYEFYEPEPQFAVSSLRDSLYVSVVWTMSDEKKTLWCKIYEVSTAGDVVKTFGGRAGRGSGQLSGSDHPLELDKYGLVIVGDEGNNRVLLLDSNLQLLTTVLNADDLKSVFWKLLKTRFCLDANLIFVKNGNQRDVAVFSLSQLQPLRLPHPMERLKPNRMLNSSCNVFSRAISDAEEFQLQCSIGSDSDDEIRGVATLTDSIYILTSSKVSVYSCTNPYRRKYGEEFATDLRDIAANVSERCLYVTDKRGRCVWSMGIDLRREKWLDDIGSPYTLSVTKDGYVLILNNKDQSLDIYNKDGERWQRIQLPYDRKLLFRHAVKMSYSSGNETYLICHGLDINQDEILDDDYNSDLLVHEILMVSSAGVVIQSFGGKIGSNVDQLYLPSHMVLDIDNTLLVADCKNNRVLRLDHQLKFLSIPINKAVHGIERPFTLCYDEITGQLIVANSISVDIFVHGDITRCLGQDESVSSDIVGNEDELETQMPSVEMIGFIDDQMLNGKVCIGATVLQDRMYLIYEGVNTVYVLMCFPPYTRLNPIEIQKMKYPRSIVSSAEHDCVYIADKGRSEIWRLLRNGQESDIFLEHNDKLMSISVTEEGHLLLLIGDNDDNYFSFVRAYDAEARCIQSIALEQQIYYAVKVGASKFFVDSVLFCDNSCTAMREMSLDGVILHSYGPFLSSYFGCEGMTLGEGNQIFVIDEAKGGRILVFGSRARLIGVLLSKHDHQMEEITGLCYIKDKRQLVVTGSDKIIIYQLSQNRGPEIDGCGRNRAAGVENPASCSREGVSGELLFTRKVGAYGGQMRAIAKLKDKLYLLLCQSLLVCTSRDLTTKLDFEICKFRIPADRSWSNSGDNGLWDLAASEVDLCLYVTDRYNHCVWRVTIDHKIKKWMKMEIGSPYTLSVTEDGCLCLLSNVYKSLDIYDRSGTKTKSIRLPSYMEYLLHAVQTPTGTYVISWTSKRQGVLNDGNEDQNDVVVDETHRNCICTGDSDTTTRGLVCEVSSDGDVLRSFSGDDPHPNQIDTSESNDLYQLAKPCNLAIDHEGRVFVADYHRSYRILLLDSHLKCMANLNEKFAQEGKYPKRLCYDRHERELFIIEGEKDTFGLPSSWLKCIRMLCQ